MKHRFLAAAALVMLTGQAPLEASAPAPEPALAPGEIVAKAAAGEWVVIAPSDLLVMDLAPDAKGKPRRVVIQLMPPPFSVGWTSNVRKLAAAHWWDGLSVNRVQDNYVVQWGDADGEDAKKAKRLPPGLADQNATGYPVRLSEADVSAWRASAAAIIAQRPLYPGPVQWSDAPTPDSYAQFTGFVRGLAVGLEFDSVGAVAWPVHCYGMVGVGRNLSPDTGSGAELYTVIGHAPRHLDRNIALIGRVIEGIEHLSSLPRGTGALGFYESAAERTGIASVRLGKEVAGLPQYEYLSTESQTFARYADARANRRDPFFIRPAGGADICNIPVPVRRVK